VGYGDSYVVAPHGQVVARIRRHREDFIAADADASTRATDWGVGRSLYSLRELGKQLPDAAARQ
jgi:hypothetical protein